MCCSFCLVCNIRWTFVKSVLNVIIAPMSVMDAMMKYTQSHENIFDFVILMELQIFK